MKQAQAADLESPWYDRTSARCSKQKQKQNSAKHSDKVRLHSNVFIYNLMDEANYMRTFEFTKLIYLILELLIVTQFF